MMEDDEVRAKMSALFSDYITAACWEKMYQRMTHWATLGFIKSLAEVSDGSIELAVQNDPTFFEAIKPDPRLASRLNTMAERHGSSSFLETVMACHPNATASEGQLSALLSECRGVAPVIYTQKTVVSIQHLLVATLVAYGSMLACIYSAKGEDRKKFASSFSIIARLLSTILNSQALASHLQFLNSNALLSLPSSALVKAYNNYAVTYHFGLADTDPRRKKYESREGGDASAGGGVDAATVPNTDEGDGTLDPEDPEFAACWSNSDDAAAVLRGWMRTFTSHYSAKRVLEHHCFRMAKTEVVEITLLSVGSEYRDVSWEEMKLTIAATLDAMPKHERPSLPTDMIISQFEAQIKDAKPTDRHAKNVLWRVKKIIDKGHLRLWCGVHCETALMALSIFGHLASVSAANEGDKQALKDLVKVISNVDSLISMLNYVCPMQRLNRSFVAVSKLCCPTCWVFSQLLRGMALGDFSVCGHHSTLYAVDFPGYLPDSLRQDMVSALRHYLGAQLRQIVLPRPMFKKQSWSLSMKSNSDLQMGTTSNQEDEVPRGMIASAMKIMRKYVMRHF